MPTTPGSPPTTLPNSPSEALCRILATGVVADAQEWRLAFAAATAGHDLALLTPFCDQGYGSDAERAAIRDALITNTARNHLFLSVLRRGLAWFAAAGLPCRVLKGAATIQDCYDDVGQRRLGDIDLLVPKDRLAEAAALLAAHDFRPLLPEFDRVALADPHTLGPDGDDHHHWPPLVGPDGVVIELHWTLGDGFVSLGIPTAALWASGTPLPVGMALAWEYRALQTTLTVPADPRTTADQAALLRRASPEQITTLERMRSQAASPPAGSRTSLPSRWSRLRTPAHVALFLRLGWQAWRYPRHLRGLPLPETANRLKNRPHWRDRVPADDVVAFVGFWQRQRWMPRPSYCLQRSALLFAGLTAIGERTVLVFGLDADHPTPLGHAWVERDGVPFLEDAALIGRMVPTYRHEATG
jgi:hypothetical protein